MRNILKRKYIGFSLVEMLLTVLLLSIIMMLVTITLNTVIKVSQASNSKNTTRADMTYIMDYIKRGLTNSQIEYIYIYDSLSNRYISTDSGQLKVSTDGDVSDIYADGKAGNMDSFDNANEIHFKMYGYDVWTCIGYFKDVTGEYGYIVRNIHGDLDVGHSSCFGEGEVVTPLHSFMVDTKSFSIDYLQVADNKNSMFIIDATLQPLYWPVKETFPITREISRQSVVSTEALTWY